MLGISVNFLMASMHTNEIGATHSNGSNAEWNIFTCVRGSLETTKSNKTANPAARKSAKSRSKTLHRLQIKALAVRAPPSNFDKQRAGANNLAKSERQEYRELLEAADASERFPPLGVAPATNKFLLWRGTDAHHQVSRDSSRCVSIFGAHP